MKISSSVKAKTSFKRLLSVIHNIYLQKLERLQSRTVLAVLRTVAGSGGSDGALYCKLQLTPAGTAREGLLKHAGASDEGEYGNFVA